MTFTTVKHCALFCKKLLWDVIIVASTLYVYIRVYMLEKLACDTKRSTRLCQRKKIEVTSYVHINEILVVRLLYENVAFKCVTICRSNYHHNYIL